MSAHWETGVPTVTSGQRPGLIYDYYNFPKEAYEVCSRLWAQLHNGTRLTNITLPDQVVCPEGSASRQLEQEFAPPQGRTS